MKRYIVVLLFAFLPAVVCAEQVHFLMGIYPERGSDDAQYVCAEIKLTEEGRKMIPLEDSSFRAEFGRFSILRMTGNEILLERFEEVPFDSVGYSAICFPPMNPDEFQATMWYIVVNQKKTPIRMTVTSSVGNEIPTKIKESPPVYQAAKMPGGGADLNDTLNWRPAR